MTKYDTMWDQWELANYAKIPVELVQQVLTVMKQGYICGDVYYIDPKEFDEKAFVAEAYAYRYRDSIFEFIEDHPGCIKSEIIAYIEDTTGETIHRDTLNIVLRMLTDKYVDLYEDDKNKLSVYGCDF